MVDAIQIINLVGTLGFLGFVWNISEGNKKKVSYESFDRYREDAEGKFRSKELCDVYIAQTQKDMAEIKESTKCIPKIKANLDLLLNKNDIKTDG